jgi:hypothetical protein
MHEQQHGNYVQLPAGGVNDDQYSAAASLKPRRWATCSNLELYVGFASCAARFRV